MAQEHRARMQREATTQKITRRGLLAGAGAVTTVTVTGTAFGRWEPSERYPDPAIQILDPSFARYRLALAGVERIATNMRWCEGPVYFGDARCLLWSDIPNNRIMRWDEETGRVSVYRKPSNNANGNTRDRQGRLVTCEHDSRRVTRTEYDGTITVLIDKFDGKPLNSPNDVVVKSDDSIWFTDPPFGILGNYEGHVATPELPTNVYRLDKTGRATVVAGDINRPNGLAFSPDESKLYIVEAGVTPRVIRAYDVVDNGSKLANGRAFITAEPGGTPDGFRCDVDGNLWCGWGMGNENQDGVKIFNPEGKPIGFIARAFGQCLLRRGEAQPPVHGGKPFGLFALREHAGRAGRVSPAVCRCRLWSSGRQLDNRAFQQSQTRHARARKPLPIGARFLPNQIHRTKEQKSPLNSYTVIFVLFSHFDPHSFLHARLYSSTPPNSMMRRNVRTMQNTTGCLSIYLEIFSFLIAMIGGMFVERHKA